MKNNANFADPYANCEILANAEISAVAYGTIDRRLVHRQSVHEVFILGEQRLGLDRFRLGAQIPVSHSQYNDTSDYEPDRLALVECVRQAQAVISHKYLGVTPGTVFILDRLKIEWGDARPGAGAVIALDVNVTSQRHLGDRLRSAVFECELIGPGRDSQPLAHIWMTISYVSAEVSRAHREALRGSELSWSDGVPSRRSRLLPFAVGRSWTRNVVIDDVTCADGIWTAEIVPDFQNPSMFDHPHDHVPGMVLIEAARQLVALADLAEATRSPSRAEIWFDHYVELDLPIQLALEAHDREGSLRFRVEQSERVCAHGRTWSAPTQGAA